MKRTGCVAVIFLLFIPRVFGISNYPAGARSAALSHATVSLSDCWSSFNNQAGIASLKSICSGIYHESRFGIEELSYTAATVSVPLKHTTASISISQFGKGIYKEQKFGLALAKRLSNRISAGIQLDYFLKTMPEVDRPYSLATAEAGFLLAPSDHMMVGIHLFNPVRQGYNTLTGKYKMPSIIRIGAHQRLNESVLIAAEAYKLSQFPPEVRTGIEFFPAESLVLRFGASGRPFRYSAGAGFLYNKLSVDIGFAYQDIIGLTPSVSLQFLL